MKRLVYEVLPIMHCSYYETRCFFVSVPFFLFFFLDSIADSSSWLLGIYDKSNHW
jgi:hypothetical protein